MDGSEGLRLVCVAPWCEGRYAVHMAATRATTTAANQAGNGPVACPSG